MKMQNFCDSTLCVHLHLYFIKKNSKNKLRPHQHPHPIDSKLFHKCHFRIGFVTFLYIFLSLPSQLNFNPMLQMFDVQKMPERVMFILFDLIFSILYIYILKKYSAVFTKYFKSNLNSLKLNVWIVSLCTEEWKSVINS